MHMEITAHGFILRSTLRADIERQIGRFVQAEPRALKRVAVDLFEERERPLRRTNRHCRVQVECLNDDRETVSQTDRDFRAAVSEAFLKLLRRLPY